MDGRTADSRESRLSESNSAMHSTDGRSGSQPLRMITEDRPGWWDLSVASLDIHLPADWEATCAGVGDEASGALAASGVRVSGPDGTAYRLYGCEEFGYYMRAGVMDEGPVVDLDSEGAVTHRTAADPVDFETALRIIVDKAQAYAAGDRTNLS